MEHLLPFLLMMMVECVEVTSMTLVKAAMNNGMSQLVYVVYHNALGTILLFPFFAFHNHKSNWPPISWSLIFRFLILGTTGIGVLQPLAFVGIGYSSPALASALGNMVPAFTYIIAIILRVEKLDIKSSSSRAKSSGTAIAISGAFVLTLYKGPEFFKSMSSNSPDKILLSHSSTWVLGGLVLAITVIIASTFNVLQTTTVREHPDEITMVFSVCCFGTLQCAIISLSVERKLDTWVLSPGIEIMAVVFGGVFGSALRSRVFMWCLHKKGPVYAAMFKPVSMVIAVIMGITFLGDTLYSGSVIGTVIIAAGFYAVVWGQANEKNNLAVVPWIVNGNLLLPKLLFSQIKMNRNVKDHVYFSLFIICKDMKMTTGLFKFVYFVHE